MSRDRFDELVTEFHQDLVESIKAFSGSEPIFKLVQVRDGLIVRLSQSHDGKPGLISLYADEQEVLGVSINFQCTWDSTLEYLAIEKSSVGVYPLAKTRGEPLFRVEYVRHQQSQLPCAHFHVHAHRDEFTHLLGNGGSGSRTARKRRERDVSQGPAYLSGFHFPTGGPRFRPILEDVLESLRVEFGVDVTDSWNERLGYVRKQWRKRQLAAAVRDSPDEAIKALERVLKQKVTISGPIPEDNESRLTQS